MKSGVVKSTDLVCLDCGDVFSIMRKVNLLKKVSHFKHLWCYKCMAVTKHYEVVDIAKFMWLDTNDKTELYVKELIKNGKNKGQKESDRIFKKVLKKQRS